MQHMRVNAVRTNCNCGKQFHFCIENGTDDYLLVLFRCPCTVYTDAGYQDTQPMHWGIFDKAQRQEYYCGDCEFLHDYIRFEPETPADAALLQGMKLHRLLPRAADGKVAFLFELMAMEFYAESTHRADKLSLLLLTLLTEAKEYAQNAKSSAGTQALSLINLRAEMYSNPQNAPSVTEAARSEHMSGSYFQSLYKKNFGISFVQDVIRTRMEKAKLLLVNTELSISDIAYACGYENVEHFCRQFKRATDHTPKHYRKAHK